MINYNFNCRITMFEVDLILSPNWRGAEIKDGAITIYGGILGG